MSYINDKIEIANLLKASTVLIWLLVHADSSKLNENMFMHNETIWNDSASCHLQSFFYFLLTLFRALCS